MDLFNFLTVDQWLAILRIGIGLWWLKSVFHKDLRSFVTRGMANWTVVLAENHPVEPFGKLIGGMVDKNRSWFPYLVVLGEFAVGIGLVFGFLTPISLAIAIFLNLNYLALAGVKPKDLSVNQAYQCEQGQNYNMIVPQFVLLVLGAWNVWSIDALLGLF